jgi:hypothetical protein
LGYVHATSRLLAWFGKQSRECEGGALVVIDEQERTRMDTEELERERAVLLPDRIEMRRHRRRRRRSRSLPELISCPPATSPPTPTPIECM